MKPLSFPYIALVTLLIILNVIAVNWFSIAESRWVRVMSAAIFLGVHLVLFSKHTLLLAGALASLLIADIFTLSYHLESSKDGFFIFHGIAYTLLFLFITKGAMRKQWSRFQKNYILITSALCFGLLLYFGFSFSSEIKGVQHMIYFYFHGLALIACLITALSFYERKANSYSLLYLGTALALIFSDITAFPAEYLKAEEFYYFSRIFYVAGLAGLVHFSFSYRSLQVQKPEEIPTPGATEPARETSYHDH